MMKHIFKHNLDEETTSKALKMAWESYSKRLSRYNPSIEWLDERRVKIRFTIGPTAIDVGMTIKFCAIEVSARVPLIFRIFKKQAIAVIEREIYTWSRAVIAKKQIGT